MQFWIARHNRSRMRPIFRMRDQFCSAWIIQHIETYFGKNITPPLFFSQNVIVRLMLKTKWTQQFPNVLA